MAFSDIFNELELDSVIPEIKNTSQIGVKCEHELKSKRGTEERAWFCGRCGTAGARVKAGLGCWSS